MKKLVMLCAVLLCAFASDNTIGKCYISFAGTKELVAAAPQELPVTADKTRDFPIDGGMTGITILDGYRILYNNDKKAPFVNMKVELSDPSRYGQDTTNVLANLKYLMRTDSGIEKSLVTLQYNNYVIYGIRRNTIDKGMILGSFVMFPGNNIIVYFDFQNLNPPYRQFNSLQEFKGQSNGFIGDYTYYLNTCTGKGFQK